MCARNVEEPRRKFRPGWVRGSVGSGDRASGQLGSGLEFADFRDYQLGDDARRLDWSVYARRGELVVRDYETPRQLEVTVLMDLSESMRFGGKAEYAKVIAEIVAFTALNTGDAVSLAAHDADVVWRGPRVSSLAGLPNIRSWLDEAIASESPSGGNVIEIGRLLYNRSLVFWLSDFMFDDVESVTAEWRSRGAECVLMHVLSQDEIEPESLGRGRHLLNSLEATDHLNVDLDRPALEAYRLEMAKWITSLGTLASRNDGWYFRLGVDDDPDSVVRAWSTAGLLS